MNKILTTLASALLFSGVANANDNYIPIIYNLSTLFDFNPVKGSLKSLDEQVLKSGKVIQEVHIELDNNLCIKNLTIDKSPDNYFLRLRLNGNILEGEKNNRPFSIELTKNCNLLSVNENGDKMAYTLNTDGMIKDAFHLGGKISEHFYDKDSNLIRSVFQYADQIISKNEITYQNPKKKPLDYTLTNLSRHSDGFIATNACKYSNKLVPKSCQVTIQKISTPTPEPTIMMVLTKTEFY